MVCVREGLPPCTEFVRDLVLRCDHHGPWSHALPGVSCGLRTVFNYVLHSRSTLARRCFVLRRIHTYVHTTARGKSVPAFEFVIWHSRRKGRGEK